MSKELQSLLDFDLKYANCHWPCGGHVTTAFWVGPPEVNPAEVELDISSLDLDDLFKDIELPHEKQADGTRFANGKIVNVRSHRGSGRRSIEINDLKRVSHLPQAGAAATLGLGATRFKSILRELGLVS